MRRVGVGAWKAEALDRLGNDIGNRRRVGAGRIGREAFKSPFSLNDGTGDGRRITAIDDEGIEAIELEVVGEPVRTALLRNLGTFLYAPAVEDHDWNWEARIFSAPPPGRPVRAALLFEGPVAQEGDEAFAGQRRMDVLNFGEAEIATLRDGTGGVRTGMTAERDCRSAVGVDGIGAPLRRRNIPRQRVDRLDRGDRMALSHHP